jgi:hypothetical protein
LKSRVIRAVLDSNKALAINAFVADAILFIIFCSKFLNSHLHSSYQYMGTRSFVSRFSEQFVRYPLYLHVAFNTQVTIMGFLCVYSDLAKLWRALNVMDGSHSCFFKDAPDFFLLLQDMYSKYF